MGLARGSPGLRGSVVWGPARLVHLLLCPVRPGPAEAGSDVECSSHGSFQQEVPAKVLSHYHGTPAPSPAPRTTAGAEQGLFPSQPPNTRSSGFTSSLEGDTQHRQRKAGGDATWRRDRFSGHTTQPAVPRWQHTCTRADCHSQSSEPMGFPPLLQ